MRTRSLLCACAAAAGLSLLLAGNAVAQSGGITGGGQAGESGADGTYYPYWFGARDLSLGMAGEDVKTLNWVLRGLALGTPTDGSFRGPTDNAVRSFQNSAGVQSDGVVDKATRKALSSQMLTQEASYYGAGLYGNGTACGKVTLTKKTIGVAHKKLPCGTKVVFAYQGRWVRAKVIDRGPYIPGRKWDVTTRVAKMLGILDEGVADLKVAVAP